ncbi:MAG TPA: M1 family aminopeptidase [Pyrinomonadaceae bacterium]|nr:M1 family aminopeptidase [Pyrinomonadaceae bacterium]
MTDDLLEAGVGRELARWRAAHYGGVRYELSVALAAGAPLMRGSLTVSVTLDGEAGDLVLDWRVREDGARAESRVSNVAVNGAAVGDARFVNDHIVIRSPHLRAGENVVRLSFESPVTGTGSDAVTRYTDGADGAEYVYTLLVPSDASTVFPCFDQPDLKARFRLAVTSPSSWTIISNTAPASVETDGPHKLTAFRETEPVSTYLFAFAAGPFAEVPDADSPHATRLYVRRSQAERARREAAEILRLNRECVAFFESYFETKFPFSKYDLVVLPEFAYRGMEHAGATFLREETLLLAPNPNMNEALDRAEVILHEAAHQWFGDLVTMRWFDDLWLKEGFATFMAYKALEVVMPRVDAWKSFHARTKPLAYLTDASRGTTPVRQEIPNLSAAKSAYGNIVYRKAPSLLRQAEFYLGREEFRRAVRTLLREHAYGSAEWADLVRAFERASGRDLAAWADAWVRRRGLPIVTVARDERDARTLRVGQRDALGEGGVWPMRLELLARSAGGTERTRDVLLEGREARVRIDELAGEANEEANDASNVELVFANSNDYGYGLFLLDEGSRARVLDAPGRLGDDFTSTLLLGSLWESVRRAEVAPLAYVELAARVAPNLREEVTLQALLARAATAHTRYLSASQRRRVAPRLEAVLREGMLTAETPGLRVTFLRAFRDTATTGAALDELVRLLTGETVIPGAHLAARDRFELLRALTAAGDPRAAQLLADESARDASDDARRYAFAARAAAPAPEVKREYFDAFTRGARVAESWIEAALLPFNSPNQTALTLPYLEPALRELPRLKRTRKIFFVNAWLAAFVGGQCGAGAVSVVENFLRGEPRLDPDLRLKILEAADSAERCARVRDAHARGEEADSPGPPP